jgi:hypothetical protein
MCVDCVLALPRIAQVDPGDEPLPPPLSPLACGLAPHGLRVTNISIVALSLVEFQMFL